MSAQVTFGLIWPPNGGDQPLGLSIYTSVLRDVDGTTGSADWDLIPSGTRAWDLVTGTRGLMAEAVEEALKTGESYPRDQAWEMLDALGWGEGLGAVLKGKPSHLRLTMDPGACPFLPELVPVDSAGGQAVWLDQLFPLYRTVNHVMEGPVARTADRSVAILSGYADDDCFADRANRIQRDLKGLRTQTYRGDEFTGDETQDLRLVHEIFRTHRAVLYLGHLWDRGNNWGWWLGPEYALTMAKLRGYLVGPEPAAGGSRRRRGTAATLPVPEVVFANCCYSAGRNPQETGQAGLSFPMLFLDAGVRFFIGTSVHPWWPPGSDTPERFCKITVDFFQAWAAQPEAAVQHLFEVKKRHGFPLFTALYQIYAQSGDTSGAASTEETVSALLSGLAPDDELGPYTLEREMWTDPYARTFWARSVSGEPRLLQVLVDEWQSRPGIGHRLGEAIERLAVANLSAGHLVPASHELLMLRRGGRDDRRLHVLVYDLAPGDAPERWKTLEQSALPCASKEERQETLRLAAAASCLLGELHASDLPHRNLDPTTLLLHGEPNGLQVVLRDAWVRLVVGARGIRRRHAAPEEGEAGAELDELKCDCWALGALLYRLVSGEAPFGESDSPKLGLRQPLGDAMLQRGVEIPEALDRVTRECLAPGPALRPDVKIVAGRLLVALRTDGNYLEDFEVALVQHLAANHRLFQITYDDPADVETMLRHLEALGYHVCEAQEGVGLRDRLIRRIDPPWLDRAAYDALGQQAAAAAGVRPPPPPTADFVAAANGETILSRVAELGADPRTGLPVIVVLHGYKWWCGGPVAPRILRNLQENPVGSAAVIIADTYPGLEASLERHVVGVTMPPPTPAALFEEILSFPRAQQLDVPPVPPEMATRLVRGFFPVSRRVLREALRMCAFAHGVIDERALQLADDIRERTLAALPALTYVPVSRLPDPSTVGLPPGVATAVEQWTECVQSAGMHEFFAAPIRILITGPDGCGKTSLAHCLAARIGRPLVRLDLAGCLQSALGGSEQALRAALHVVNSLHGCVVLLDDIDRFLPGETQGPPPEGEGTFARMSGFLLNWLDNLPPWTIAILTTTDASNLSGQCRRRMELPLPLPEPLDGSGPYRTAVFAAVFRRYGLSELARDSNLTCELAGRTDPQVGIPRLLSPLGRRAALEGLRQNTTRLATGADIAAWVRDTILLHQSPDARPEDREFWRDALVSAP